MDLNDVNEENVDITTEDVVDTVEQTAEVAETTEEPVQDTEQAPKGKVFTQEQVNQMMADRAKRAEQRAERKYSRLTNTLYKATGAKSLDELESTVNEFYKSQGVDVSMPTYNDREEEILAYAEADEIIGLGYDEIVAETENLMAKGYDNLSTREKFEFKKLAEERQRIEQSNELRSIGVSEDAINSDDFKTFRAKFKDDTSLKDVYEMYSKLQPKEDIKPIGSMKSENSKDEIKNYYSPEDFDKLTPEQLDNPLIMEAVDRSRVKWYRK